MLSSSHIYKQPPSVVSYGAVGGKKEYEGPLGKYFDKINEDPYFSTDTYEKAESQLQKQALRIALEKGGLTPDDIGVVFGGDLLNQCVGTTYGIRSYGIPYLGIYSACSTMSEGLLLASLFVEGGYADRAAALTSSHFCSAERQYRLPLNYGGQRTPTSQWTATAAGALCIAREGKGPYVRGHSVGRITDMGVTDPNNMGAAMAPAAFSTISGFFDDTGLSPEDFDLIVTGDLGLVGSRLLCEIFDKQGQSIHERHRDCGVMLFDAKEQDAHAGGSGCGCGASVLCCYLLPELRAGRLRNILFAATGALLSPTVNLQGESIPAISHLVWLSSERE